MKLFKSESEFVAFVSLPRHVIGGGRTAEERRIGGSFDGFAVGHEFQQTQPAVAAIAAEAAADGLSVENHLGDTLACAVFRPGEANCGLPVIRAADMTANDHADIFGGENQLLEDLFAGVAACFAQRIFFTFDASTVGADVAVGQDGWQNGAYPQFFSPRQDRRQWGQTAR